MRGDDTPSADRPVRLLVLSQFPPGVGGGEMQTLLQLREIAKRGHAVTVIDLCPRYEGPFEERVHGIRVIRVPTPRAPIARALAYHGRIAWSVLKLARRSDVAQFNHLGTGLFTAVPILRLFRVPAIVVLWGSAAEGVGPFGPGWRFRLARWLARGFERQVALATLTAEALKRHGFDPARVRYIPNGVETARFRPAGARGAPDEAARARERSLVREADSQEMFARRSSGEDVMGPVAARDPGGQSGRKGGQGRPRGGTRPPGWPESGTAAISVGRLVPAKGLEVLLDAWARVVDRHPESRLALVGDGPLRVPLEERAKALGIGAKVLFLGNREDVPELLRCADIYVSASRTEGMSNAILEALSTGLPIVATRVGSAQDILDHGLTGFVVPAGQSEELASAVGHLLDDPALRARIGTAARGRALEEFSIDAVLDRYIALYREVARGC